MGSWQLQQAKARFSEFLETPLREGPQIVTRRGVEIAVLVPVDEWRHLQKAARPTLKQLLRAPAPRVDEPVLARRAFRRRQPLRFH